MNHWTINEEPLVDLLDSEEWKIKFFLKIVPAKLKLLKLRFEFFSNLEIGRHFSIPRMLQELLTSDGSNPTSS